MCSMAALSLAFAFEVGDVGGLFRLSRRLESALILSLSLCDIARRAELPALSLGKDMLDYSNSDQECLIFLTYKGDKTGTVDMGGGTCTASTILPSLYYIRHLSSLDRAEIETALNVGSSSNISPPRPGSTGLVQ